MYTVVVAYESVLGLPRFSLKPPCMTCGCELAANYSNLSVVIGPEVCHSNRGHLSVVDEILISTYSNQSEAVFSELSFLSFE
jgi:hypothetical protein